MSIIFELYLAFKYINSSNEAEALFGITTLMEGIIGAIGLFLTAPLTGHRLRFKPEQFQKYNSHTIFRAAIILGVLLVIQMIFQYIPLTIRDEDVAIAIVFAAPAEESFFRGFLMSFFIYMSSKTPTKKIRFFSFFSISILELMGMALSSLLFSFLHVNYYGNMNLLVMVFFSGLVLCIFFWKWRDLTALILAHLFLNIWVVGKYFWMVYF